MEPVPYLLYHDDRLFVLDISTTQVRHLRDPEFGELSEAVSSSAIDASSRWTLTTRRNCPGYPPVRVDHFESLRDLVEYVQRVEPTTPRGSLSGRPPNPVPSYGEYLKWLEENQLHGALETKLRDGGHLTQPEWQERLAWEAQQLAAHLAVPPSSSSAIDPSSEGSRLDYEFLAEFAEVAEGKLAEARAAVDLLDSADPIYRRPAEEMLRVCEIIVSGVTGSPGESQLRSTIAALREAMSGGMDARASMTAHNVIELIRKILGDERIDTGPVSRTFDEAIRFLARSIPPDAKDRLKAAVTDGSSELRWSFGLGMSVRNTLRSAGFSEASLGIQNLDDVWYEMLEAALRLQDA